MLVLNETMFCAMFCTIRWKVKQRTYKITVRLIDKDWQKRHADLVYQLAERRIQPVCYREVATINGSTRYKKVSWLLRCCSGPWTSTPKWRVFLPEPSTLRNWRGLLGGGKIPRYAPNGNGLITISYRNCKKASSHMAGGFLITEKQSEPSLSDSLYQVEWSKRLYGCWWAAIINIQKYC